MQPNRLPAPRADRPVTPPPSSDRAGPLGALAPRALQIFATPLPGCILHAVADDGAEPYLRIGDIAIVDPSDHEPREGVLFLIAYNSPRPCGFHFAVVEVWPRDHDGPDGPFIGWWSGRSNRPGCVNELNEWIDAGRMFPLCEGPMKIEGLRKMLVGRIVGVLDPEASATDDLKALVLPETAAAFAREARSRGTSGDGAIDLPHDPRMSTVGNLSNGPMGEGSAMLAVAAPLSGRFWTRRSVMNAMFGTAVSAAALMPAAAAMAPPDVLDPIFAAIDAHKAAARVLSEEIRALRGQDVEDGTPAQEAIYRENETARAVFDVDPTTVAGVAALLDHYVAPELDDPNCSFIRWMVQGGRIEAEPQLAAAACVLRDHNNAPGAVIAPAAALAVAAGGSAPPDPVFAAIAAVREAEDEVKAARHAVRQLESSLEGTPDERFILEWVSVPSPKYADRFVSSHEQIDEQIDEQLAGWGRFPETRRQSLESCRVRVHAAFDAETERMEAGWQRTGMTAVRQREDAADQAYGALLKACCSTVATTAAGAAAFLQFIRGHAFDHPDGDFSNKENPLIALVSLERAVRRLAGPAAGDTIDTTSEAHAAIYCRYIKDAAERHVRALADVATGNRGALAAENAEFTADEMKDLAASVALIGPCGDAERRAIAETARWLDTAGLGKLGKEVARTLRTALEKAA